MSGVSAFESNQIKLDHLIRENNVLTQNVKELQEQLTTLRKINKCLLEKGQSSIHILTKQLSKRIQQLQSSYERLNASNSQYLCQLLMKDQLICQIHKQYAEIISNYEQKVSDLMGCLEKKEEYVNRLQEKFAKQKKERIEIPTRTNIMYFNQIYELRVYVQRINIENSQLKYINSKRQIEIAILKKIILTCQQTFRKSQLWQTYQKNIKSIQESAILDSKKSGLRMKLQSQISKFDRNVKEITPKKIHSQTMNGLKLITTHLNNQNIMLIKENIRYQSKAKTIDYQYGMIQKAYKKLQEQFCRQKEYIELLKMSLDGKKEAVRRQPQQNLTNLIKEKETFIKYWKRFLGDENWKLISNKCILRIKPSKSIKRSHSCPSIFKYLKQSQKVQKVQDDLKQQSFSYILESCNPDLVVNQSISQRKIQSSQEFFNQEISIISKPKPSRFKNQYDGELKQIDFQQ